jgi:hypothetical protein
VEMVSKAFDHGQLLFCRMATFILYDRVSGCKFSVNVES